MATWFLAARTDADTFATTTDLRLGDGFVELASGFVGGLYPATRALQVVTALRRAGVEHQITGAESYAEGRRRLRRYLAGKDAS